MKVEQIYTGCLAQGAYYITSNGEAAIIDPLREVQPYLDQMAKDGVALKYIFETHFHADFVSGHVTLSEKTGAPIVYGPTANTKFDAIIAKDNQEFKVGDVTIKVLHTPGHTMESTTYLLKDEHGKDHAIFSGDTLFLGDVGRPDLAQKNGKLTIQDLAGYLFESLRNKIMPLGDEVTVYPAHGAGSACGKNMMKETVDTLGNQKKVNYALRPDMSKAEFIKEVTSGLTPPPQYFGQNVRMNKEGYTSIDAVLKRGVVALNPTDFAAIANTADALILDVRHKSEFVKKHIPGSIFIGLDGTFAPWVGALILDIQQNILLVAPEGKEEEAVTRLARVGYDNTLGYLKGGVSAWENAGKETDNVESISPAGFAKAIKEGTNRVVLDVRKPTEYLAHHVDNATNIPLDYLNKNMDKLNRTNPYFLYCGSGFRSVIAASILKARGFHDLIDVQEGFKGIESNGTISLSNYQCPTTISQQVIDLALAEVA